MIGDKKALLFSGQKFIISGKFGILSILYGQFRRKTKFNFKIQI